jgi:hypothetical protein
VAKQVALSVINQKEEALCVANKSTHAKRINKQRKIRLRADMATAFT